MHPQTLRIYEARGLIKPAALAEADAALLAARRRAPEAHPGAHDRVRHEPRRRRARARAGGADGRDAGSSSAWSRPSSWSARCCARIDEVHRSYKRELVPLAAARRAASRTRDPSDELPTQRAGTRMQADKFTIKSQEAIQAAQRLAHERGNPEITPEHLLAVLLEQEGGIVAPLLAKLGVAPDDRAPARERGARQAAVRERRGRVAVAPVRRAGARLPGRRARGRGAEGRVHLDRAPAARARRVAGRGRGDPAARRRTATRSSRRCARCAARTA